jgi:hypothetical protein
MAASGVAVQPRQESALETPELLRVQLLEGIDQPAPPPATSAPPAGWCFGPSPDWEGAPVPDHFSDLSAPPADIPLGPAGDRWREVEVQEPVTFLGLRHSSTHGRNVGRGRPLVGTSWLNRPYFVGVSLGPMWFTQRVDDSVGRDVDTFGDIFIGFDWDHFWGSELQVGRATPELINTECPLSGRSDRISFWSYSHLYYPWGDSLLRPYMRVGIGTTEVSFPRDSGRIWNEYLLTFPLGVGVKYPLRRWLAARMEVTDYLALGEHHVGHQNNVALVFSLEWRFGVHPKSYWPWNPSRHIR